MNIKKIFTKRNVLRFFGIVLAAFALLILFVFVQLALYAELYHFLVIGSMIGILGISLVLFRYLTRLPIGLILFLNLIMILTTSEMLDLSSWWRSNNSPTWLIILSSAILIGLLIYTIVSFIKSKPNALFLGKLFLGLFLFDWVLNPIRAALRLRTVWSGDVGERCLSLVLEGWDWGRAWTWGVVNVHNREEDWILISLCIIALVYLFFSKQIQTLFPKEQRTIFTIDKVIAIVAVIVIIVKAFWHIIQLLPRFCW